MRYAFISSFDAPANGPPPSERIDPQDSIAGVPDSALIKFLSCGRLVFCLGPLGPRGDDVQFAGAQNQTNPSNQPNQGLSDSGSADSGGLPWDQAGRRWREEQIPRVDRY